MFNHEKPTNFVDVHFDVTQEERVRSFLEQFAPDYKGYLLDQTPNQIHSKEFIIRIYYQDAAYITITCYSEEMIQQRIQNIFNINSKAKFANRNPVVEKHTFNTTTKGKDDITVYYSARLEFEFI